MQISPLVQDFTLVPHSIYGERRRSQPRGGAAPAASLRMKLCRQAGITASLHTHDSMPLHTLSQILAYTRADCFAFAFLRHLRVPGDDADLCAAALVGRGWSVDSGQTDFPRDGWFPPRFAREAWWEELSRSPPLQRRVPQPSEQFEGILLVFQRSCRSPAGTAFSQDPKYKMTKSCWVFSSFSLGHPGSSLAFTAHS